MNGELSDELKAREQLLLELLRLESPLPELKRKLSLVDWDVDEELVVLRPTYLLSILEKFSRNEIASQEVEEWANLVEGREDIGFVLSTEPLCKDVLHELANPELTRTLSNQSAAELLERLQRIG